MTETERRDKEFTEWYQNIDKYLRTLEDSLWEIFRKNSIYVGAIDTRKLDDDVLFDYYADFLPSGLRVCFSTHDRWTVIPMSVLKEIEDLPGEFTMEFAQAPSHGTKEMYLYLNIDLTLDYIMSLK